MTTTTPPIPQHNNTLKIPGLYMWHGLNVLTDTPFDGNAKYTPDPIMVLVMEKRVATEPFGDNTVHTYKLLLEDASIWWATLFADTEHKSFSRVEFDFERQAWKAVEL